MSVRSSVLSPEDTRAYTEFLQSVAEGFVGQAMIKDVMKEGMEWLRDNNINVVQGKDNGQKEKKKGSVYLMFHGLGVMSDFNLQGCKIN